MVPYHFLAKRSMRIPCAGSACNLFSSYKLIMVVTRKLRMHKSQSFQQKANRKQTEFVRNSWIPNGTYVLSHKAELTTESPKRFGD